MGGVVSRMEMGMSDLYSNYLIVRSLISIPILEEKRNFSNSSKLNPDFHLVFNFDFDFDAKEYGHSISISIHSNCKPNAPLLITYKP